jgi:sRNA-binding carbon storage regulator CsrA
MLLLMRREGEMIRINEKITIQIKDIQAESVTFQVEGLNENSEEKEENKET